MKLNREKFLAANKGHNIGAALDAIDGLLKVLDGYVNADDMANAFGNGCFPEPSEYVKNCLGHYDIKQYVIFDGEGVKP